MTVSFFFFPPNYLLTKFSEELKVVVFIIERTVMSASFLLVIGNLIKMRKTK